MSESVVIGTSLAKSRKEFVSFFCDTSVLVAASDVTHQHHIRSIACVTAAQTKDAFCSAHSLAELYGVLTAIRNPGMRRVEDVLAGVERAALSFKPISLSAPEYLWVIRHVASLGGRSGIVYDALVLKCAEKARVNAIYTWNAAHFLRIGWPAVLPLIRAP